MSKFPFLVPEGHEAVQSPFKNGDRVRDKSDGMIGIVEGSVAYPDGRVIVTVALASWHKRHARAENWEPAP